MTKHLPDGGYRPPHPVMCTEELGDFPWPTEGLPGLSRIHVALRYDKRGLVHYSISQQWRADNVSAWQNVFRIDTSDGSLHFHRFKRDGTDEKGLIQELPIDGRDIVNGSYDESYTRVHNGMDERLRGWLK